MADNTRGGSQDAGDPLIATDEVTYSGDTADVQLIRLVSVSGAEGSKTVDAISDAAGLLVHGDVASGAADTGSPVKVGGRSSFSGSIVDDGDRNDLWLGLSGQVILGSEYLTQTGDAVNAANFAGPMLSDSSGAVHLGVVPWVFNGSTWDRLRGDTLGLHVSRQATSATATVTSVAGSASSVTLLSLNTARKGATIHNDSAAILYVKLGTTASTSSFTVKMVTDAYYEVPFGYTGRIDGIWASATGNARITELT